THESHPRRLPRSSIRSSQMRPCIVAMPSSLHCGKPFLPSCRSLWTSNMRCSSAINWAKVPEMPASDSATPLLEARGIGTYFGNVVALHYFSFDVCAGDVHALVGENGARKSTLLA